MIYLKLLVFSPDGDQDHYHLEGLMESPPVDDDEDCFSPMLLNATSINVEVYYNKAVNYTLMVTFVSSESCYFIDAIFSINCICVDSLTY